MGKEIINSSKISDYIAKEENNKKKVLFTTDGTECSLSVIEKIISDMELSDKEVHICMVNEDPNLLFLEGTLDTNWLLDIQKQQYMYASNSIEAIKQIIESKGIEVNGNLREEVYKTILSIDEMQEAEVPIQIKAEDKTPEESIELVELKAEIIESMKKLPARERELIEYKFFKEKKLREIAEEFNISQSRISRIIQSGLDKIKRDLKKQGIL